MCLPVRGEPFINFLLVGFVWCVLNYNLPLLEPGKLQLNNCICSFSSHLACPRRVLIKGSLTQEDSISDLERLVTVVTIAASCFFSFISIYSYTLLQQDTVSVCTNSSSLDMLALGRVTSWLMCPLMSPSPSISPVLGVVPELCQCRDLELDCDSTQLQDIPVVAINVTMMWVENNNFCFFFFSYIFSVSRNPQWASPYLTVENILCLIMKQPLLLSWWAVESLVGDSITHLLCTTYCIYIHVHFF